MAAPPHFTLVHHAPGVYSRVYAKERAETMTSTTRTPSDNLTAKLAEKAALHTPGQFFDREAEAAWSARRYDTDMLQADVEEGQYGVQTHPNRARHLLLLDTPERRRRAAAEAQTLTNLQGGQPSGHVWAAVVELRALIMDGHENTELYGERTAREYREREAELRTATGNPAAIYYPAR